MLALICWLSALLFSQSPSSQIVDGYMNTLSAFPGDSVELYLNSRYADTYNLKLYDLSGKAVSSFKIPVFLQSTLSTKPYENGFGYRLTKRIKVPQYKTSLESLGKPAGIKRFLGNPFEFQNITILSLVSFIRNIEA
jgi:hypothetical protein